MCLSRYKRCHPNSNMRRRGYLIGVDGRVRGSIVSSAPFHRPMGTRVQKTFPAWHYQSINSQAMSIQDQSLSIFVRARNSSFELDVQLRINHRFQLCGLNFMASLHSTVKKTLVECLRTSSFSDSVGVLDALMLPCSPCSRDPMIKDTSPLTPSFSSFEQRLTPASTMMNSSNRFLGCRTLD